MRIDWDVPVPMEDEVVLRADVYRPIEPGHYPVILTYGPYGKGLPFQVGYPDQWKMMVTRHPDVTAGSANKYQNWEVVDPEKWVPHGYVCVRADSRGAGRSPGIIDCFSPRETRDFYHCIEWAGAQPWSNGKVGLLGISYYAMNQWHVASLQPPHLIAMCPWEGAADYYRDMFRHGGILTDFWHNWYIKQVETVQHGLGRQGPVDPNSGLLVAGPETLTVAELARNRADIDAPVFANALDNSFYQERSPDWSSITVPFLSAANWGGQGLHPRGNFEGFVRAASKQKWLEVHGLEHWTHFYTDYGRNLQKRFFDYFLKGIENGWDKQPRVQLQIRHIGKFVERHETEWPLARTRWTPLYLDPSRRTLEWAPVTAQSKVEYKGLSEGVTFISAPLHEEMEITGPASVKLFLASSTVDADLFTTLRVFDPNGGEIDFQGALDPHTPIGQGWLRASHRKLDPQLSTSYRPYHTHDEIQLLVKGQPYELDIEIWPTCIVIPAGYRIALTVQGKDFERAAGFSGLGTFVNPMRGSGPFTHTHPQDRPSEIFDNTHAIYGGGSWSSRLLLPIIPVGTLQR
ncbi:MAG: CocE/NonD family hydrolase [Acidobacteria bacterium]|nr:CocE/NonD family hydrolase [Acidobacteriota bacterium]